MKQSEKLDLLLKGYYAKKDNHNLYFPHQILQENGIPYTDNREATMLAKRLYDDKLITAQNISGLRIRGKITSHGIDYVEEDSYTYKGSSIINNNYHTTISNSSGISIVSSSSNVHVNISNIGDVNNKIEELLEKIQSSYEVPGEIKTEMIDCLEEMKASLSQDRKPKHSFAALLNMANNFAGISTLAIEVGKLIFG